MNESFEDGVGVVGSTTGGGGGKGYQEDDDNLVLWVGNLDSRTTENMVYELFCQAGPISNIRLPKNPDGQGHKGYSFVTFHHEASVPYAINVMEGTTLFGKRLKLQPRPGSVHRKLMDQKKATEQRLDDNFPLTQQIPVMVPPSQQVPVSPQQPQQWFAHPQMAQVSPNMFLYQNQLYQSFTPNSMNMNVMAIPFQTAPQIGGQFVQIPLQPGGMPPIQQPPIRNQNSYSGGGPRMPNSFNQYMPSQPQHVRAASPHQSGNPSHYNNQQMNGHHQTRGHFQRGNRPQRNNNGGGYSNGSSHTGNTNNRMPSYHQRMPNNNSMTQQQPSYMINAFQGQTMQMIQNPDFRRGSAPPPLQQQTFPQGQTYPNGYVHAYPQHQPYN